MSKGKNLCCSEARTVNLGIKISIKTEDSLKFFGDILELFRVHFHN
jgi:hypothetical protein